MLLLPPPRFILINGLGRIGLIRGGGFVLKGVRGSGVGALKPLRGACRSGAVTLAPSMELGADTCM